MVEVRSFRAVRPTSESAQRVLALPYDVMNVAEARAMAEGRPDSFLHVSRAEIDLDPSVDPYDDSVYAQSAVALGELLGRGVLVRDEAPTLSVYRMTMGHLVQSGLVVAASVDDYASGAIKKHELTRPDKENDRVRHIDSVGAHDEPVFLLSPPDSVISGVIATALSRPPDYSAESDAGVRHEVWVVADDATIAAVESAYASMPALYVADGHHRSAAAERVRDLRRARATSDDVSLGGADRFLAVVVPADAVTLMPYHRAVADLAGLDHDDFLAAVAERFAVTAVDQPVQPERMREFGMFLGGQWYRLEPLQWRPDDVLDVDVLQADLLEPVLGITDPRRDQRLHFIGGIRGLPELERLVDQGLDAVSFSLMPTSVDQLIAVADRDDIMPPKSTWFEPKLGSGLFVHPMSDV